jgi:beta-lactamase class A
LESIKGEKYLKKGDKKTIAEIVEYMIKYSDNNAVYILGKNIDKNILLNTYRDLGIEFPSLPSYTISVRTYSSFYRILYNATYLSKEYSEKALKLLSELEFRDGLVAGVPEDVKVSHKFGERNLGDGKKQIHDCGIVYYSKTPYLLCIMTRGKENNELVRAVAKISKIVFDEIVK